MRVPLLARDRRAMSVTRSESQPNRLPPVSVNVCSVGSTLIAAGSSSASAETVSSRLPEQPGLRQSTSQGIPSQSRPVTVRVLGRPAVTVTESEVNFNVKIFNSENKKEHQVFVLRDVSQAVVSTPETLMQEMRKQFGSHVAKKRPFAVGYMKGNMKVSIRTPADMSDVWLHVSRGENVTIWCEGIGHCGGSDSDDEIHKKRRKKRKKVSALEEKNERIEEMVGNLRKKHDSRYTSIQYRLWAEMIDIGTHR